MARADCDRQVIHHREQMRDSSVWVEVLPATMSSMDTSPGVPEVGSLPDTDSLAFYHASGGRMPLDRAALDSWLTRGNGTAGGFQLDVHAAGECVIRMRNTVGKLLDLEEDLASPHILPEPLDLVSRNFVQNCSLALQEAQNYLITWRQQLEDAIDSLDEQIKSYGAVEQQNRLNMT